MFLHKTQLTEFVNAVEDLRVLEKTGYPCRECGQIFKFHSIRVKYVLLFIPLETNNHVLYYYMKCATAIAYMFLSCSYYYYYYTQK